MKEKKYVILEIIPTAINKGIIVQLSALKINGLKLVDRFDYRINKEKINIPDILKIIDYDNKNFKYVESDNIIIDEFRKFIEDYDLLFINNLYTRNYLVGFDNKKEDILDYLKFKYSDDVVDKIIDKYNIEPTNHIVDILYEALIFESGEDNGNSK